MSVKSWLTKEPNTKRPNVLYTSQLSRATLNIRGVTEPYLTVSYNTIHTHLAYCLNRFFIVKAIVRAFNKEMDGPSPGTASLTFIDSST